MKNFKYSGQSFSFVAVAAISSGDVVVKGEYVGVAVADAAIGQEVECQRTGVVELQGDAVTVVQGEKAYYDSGLVSNVVAGDEIGVFHKDGASGSKMLVLLKGGAASFN